MCNLVQVCECCNTKFSQIDISLISSKHKESLYKHLNKTTISLQLKGDTTLAIADDVIFGVMYSYVDANEAEKAEFICDEIELACSSFFDEVLETSELEFYPS